MYQSSREHKSIRLPASQSRQANSTSASCGFNPASRNASCLIEENNRHESTSPHSVSHRSLCILSLCASRFSDKAAQGYRQIHCPSLTEHFVKPQGIPDRGACLGVVEVGVYRDLPLERGAGQHGPGLENPRSRRSRPRPARSCGVVPLPFLGLPDVPWVQFASERTACTSGTRTALLCPALNALTHDPATARSPDRDLGAEAFTRDELKCPAQGELFRILGRCPSLNQDASALFSDHEMPDAAVSCLTNSLLDLFNE